MSEQVTSRLMAAAREFNIGKDTLTEFLVSKGFDQALLKPNSKLTAEMYLALQNEFQIDKSIKKNIQAIELNQPKNVVITLQTEQENSESVIISEPQSQSQSQESATAPVEEKEITHIKIKSPAIEGPKIISKIDVATLENIALSTKKTRVKKTEKEPSKKEIIKELPVVEESVNIEIVENEKAVPIPEIIAPKIEIEKSTLIETKYNKIDGPKVLGKVELKPNIVTSHKSDVTKQVTGEVKKRKRFIVKTKQGQQNDTSKDRQNPIGAGGDYAKRNKEVFNKNKFTPQHHNVIDQQQIQDKIKETQAKLIDTNRSPKNFKSKYRKQKKELQQQLDENTELISKTISVTEFIPLREFATLLNIDYTEIISKCLSLGLMVSINHRLDAEVMELIAGEYGFDLQFLGVETALEEEIIDKPEDLEERPPIVTIMGHVDHGKTSLLDFIRKANVVAGESGGITQKIGAYEVTTTVGKKITFIDTPGHEAFTAMRARGTKVTDVAVIVIAADDAVMPTTKEAISHAQAGNINMIFAFNKIDKEGANVEKIKEQLSQMNLLVEEWGGKYQSQEISAKQGLNVDLLLEKISIESEILELKANPNRKANGTVIDASLDKGRGYLTTLLVQNGTLAVGDLIVAGQYFGKIKAMFNERNHKIEVAPPSTPVLILGMNGASQAGETFKVYESESEAKEVANKRVQLAREQGLRTKKHITLDEIGRRLALGNFKELNVIIKADVDGSVEALADSLEKLSTQEVAVKIIHRGVGQIIESDVMLAAASDAIILAFQVRPSIQAIKLAEIEAIQIKKYSVIYNVIEDIRSALEGLLEPSIEETINATVEIRNIFKFEKVVIAGCYVTSGKLLRNNKIRIIRDGVVIFTGELSSLKRYKDDVKEVPTGMECGLTIKNFVNIQEGDFLEAFEQEEVKRYL